MRILFIIGFLCLIPEITQAQCEVITYHRNLRGTQLVKNGTRIKYCENGGTFRGSFTNSTVTSKTTNSYGNTIVKARYDSYSSWEMILNFKTNEGILTSRNLGQSDLTDRFKFTKVSAKELREEKKEEELRAKKELQDLRDAWTQNMFELNKNIDLHFSSPGGKLPASILNIPIEKYKKLKIDKDQLDVFSSNEEKNDIYGEQMLIAKTRIDSQVINEFNYILYAISSEEKSNVTALAARYRELLNLNWYLSDTDKMKTKIDSLIFSKLKKQFALTSVAMNSEKQLDVMNEIREYRPHKIPDGIYKLKVDNSGNIFSDEFELKKDIKLQPSEKITKNIEGWNVPVNSWFNIKITSDSSLSDKKEYFVSYKYRRDRPIAETFFSKYYIHTLLTTSYLIPPTITIFATPSKLVDKKNILLTRQNNTITKYINGTRFSQYQYYVDIEIKLSKRIAKKVTRTTIGALLVAIYLLI